MFFNIRPTMLQLVVAGAAFGLILAAWLCAMVWWHARRRKRADKVEQRLGLVEEAGGPMRVLRLWQDGQEATVSVPVMAEHIGPIRRLEALCRNAGWSAPIGVLMAIVACPAGLVFIIMLILTGQLLAGVAGVVATLMMAWAWLKRAVNKRSALFDRQFIDAMDLARRSLQAGHPLVAAFQLVSQEIDDPVGGVFTEICEQQQLGVNLEQALRSVANKCASEDMKLFATSVAMQTHSGGNLSAMIERLAEVIRDRIRLNRRVRVLTAQTQFSKRVLIALPIALFVLLNMLNPTYMQPLYVTQTGKLLLGSAVVSILLGSWVMGRMTKLEH